MQKFSRETVYYLEYYYFKLTLFTLSADFVNLPGDKQDAIERELGLIPIQINVLNNIFPPVNEKPIIGWEKTDASVINYYRFSCATTASMILEIDSKIITDICNGVENEKNWYFEYEKDFQKWRYNTETKFS